MDSESRNQQPRVLTSKEQLRHIYRPPSSGALKKDIGCIDAHFRRFIALSPFVCMGTTGPDGFGDVTPRGGEPGFVHVIDDKHLAMPDRPGNNRIDSLGNLVSHPGVGLLFFVPGFEETLRVNGKASISTEDSLMQRFATEGKLPRTVILIEVHEAYLHCSKAVKRAQLWNPSAQVERGSFPSAGQIFRDQLSLDVEAKAVDAMLDKDAQENLY